MREPGWQVKRNAALSVFDLWKRDRRLPLVPKLFTASTDADSMPAATSPAESAAVSGAGTAPAAGVASAAPAGRAHTSDAALPPPEPASSLAAMSPADPASASAVRTSVLAEQAPAAERPHFTCHVNPTPWYSTPPYQQRSLCGGLLPPFKMLAGMYFTLPFLQDRYGKLGTPLPDKPVLTRIESQLCRRRHKGQHNFLQRLQVSRLINDRDTMLLCIIHLLCGLATRSSNNHAFGGAGNAAGQLYATSGSPAWQRRVSIKGHVTDICPAHTDTHRPRAYGAMTGAQPNSESFAGTCGI